MTFASIRQLAALLLASGIGTASLPSWAGIIYGIDYQNYNGRSGHAVYSELDITRDGFMGAYCTEGAGAGGRRIVFPFDVRDGFEIYRVDVWGVDTSVGSNLAFSLVESCQPFLSGGIPTRTILGTASSSGSAGDFLAIPYFGSHSVDPGTCAYFLEARFAADNAACVGADLAVRRVRLLTNNPDVIFRDDFEA